MSKHRIVGKLLFPKGRCGGKWTCDQAAEWEVSVTVDAGVRKKHVRKRLLCRECLVRFASLRVVRVDNVALMLAVASAICGGSDKCSTIQ